MDLKLSANSPVTKCLLALARTVLSVVACVASCVPTLNRKYKIRQRLHGPWVGGAPASRDESNASRLWLHGASLGECKMLLSLAKALKEDLPRCPPILLTTQKAEAVEVLSKKAAGVCEVSIAPADIPSTLRKFIKEAKPTALILGENELWPGYIAAMNSACGKSAVALVSGRIRRTPFGVELSQLDFVELQKDCGNWKLLDWARGASTRRGQPEESCGQPEENCGQPEPAFSQSEVKKIDVSFISFHKEELAAFCELATFAVAAEKSVVLAPRRLEEIPQFQDALRSRNIPTTVWPDVRKSTVSIVNKFGVVPEILRESRSAVVGGSFVEKPGVHDFWEPLCAGVRTFVGPYCRGAEDAVAELIESGALIRISEPRQSPQEFLNEPSNSSSIKTALQNQREKILNSYERLLKFLERNL